MLELVVLLWSPERLNNFNGEVGCYPIKRLYIL